MEEVPEVLVGDPPGAGLLQHGLGGADFVIAGMFDFQVESDVKIVIDTLPKAGRRKRPWCG